MIEVFKTDISNRVAAQKIVTLLQLQLPDSRINIDLEDCDKVLRVEACQFSVEQVILFVNKNGFYCSPLE